MKSYVLVAVLITSTVVSTVTAQDTLKIQSLRSVDLCSDRKRWLLAVSLGTISFSDSLESFDITIGFDKNVIRPTDVLKEGTLSAQMSNGPTMNTVVPGEMRIFGFNVARSVAGNFPLVAVSGDFVGSCGDKAILTLPSAPDFNSEFKRRYAVSSIDEIETIVNRRQIPNLGCSFETRADTFDVGEVRKVYVTTVSRTGSADDMRGILEYRFISDMGLIQYVESQCDNCLIDSVDTGQANAVKVHYSIQDPNSAKDNIVFRTTISRRALDVSGDAKLIASVSNRDSCACSVPTRRDTVEIVLEKSVVGIESSQDDGSCTIDVRDGVVVGKCLHHGMKELELYDLFGNTVLRALKHENEWLGLPTMDLSHGMYFARMTCGGSWKRKTIVK